VARAKRLREEGKTLREIAAILFADGHVNERGAMFSAASIDSMIKQANRQPGAG
jgi:prepilin-type processing-associated H-X9-DG protein